jgi:hypothetical protein
MSVQEAQDQEAPVVYEVTRPVEGWAKKLIPELKKAIKERGVVGTSTCRKKAQFVELLEKWTQDPESVQYTRVKAYFKENCFARLVMALTDPALSDPFERMGASASRTELEAKETPKKQFFTALTHLFNNKKWLPANPDPQNGTWGTLKPSASTTLVGFEYAILQSKFQQLRSTYQFALSRFRVSGLFLAFC